MKRTFLTLLAVQAMALTAARAYTPSFDLQADLLKTSAGVAMPVSGLYLLVASTTNATFGTLAPGGNLTLGSFLSGDDQIIGRGNLSTTSNPGSLGDFVSVDTALFSTELGGGDNIALYWFPTLTISSTALSAGNTYGFFRTDSTQDGTRPWVFPNTAVSGQATYFGTTDGFNFPGTHLPVEARASLTVVPEPSTYLLGILSALGLLITMVRHRFLRVA